MEALDMGVLRLYLYRILLYDITVPYAGKRTSIQGAVRIQLGGRLVAFVLVLANLDRGFLMREAPFRLFRDLKKKKRDYRTGLGFEGGGGRW